MVSIKVRYWTAAAASGVAWGCLAWMIGAKWFGSILWGGAIAAPVIGLVIAGFAGPWSRMPTVGRVVLALVALYLAAALFGLAIGVFDWVSGPRESRVASGVILQAPAAVLWGLTFAGYFVLLWPLAYLNLWWISQLDRTAGIGRRA